MTLEQFIKKLRTLDLDKWAGRFGSKYSEQFRKHLTEKPYPPELAGQKYVRTGILGASYTNRQIRERVHEIGNNAPYAMWVIGKRIFPAPAQAAIHKGRWFTIQDEQVKYFDQEAQEIAVDLFAKLIR